MGKNHFRVFYLVLVCLLVLYLAVGSDSEALHAQTAFRLPSDLIFSTGAVTLNGLPQTHNILARLDASTGQVNRFYTDESAVFLKALTWSPDGNNLVILRGQYDGKHYPAQLCLLSRGGVLQGCFDDVPIGYFSIYNTNGITWSANGERLYFVGGDEKIRRLIEADVKTRKTLRVLYEYPLSDAQMDNPPVLAWTNDLRYLTIGAGDNTRVQQGLPVLLVALNTKQTIDLTHIPGTAGASLFVVCPFFSPDGTYLTAYNFDVPETPVQPQFLILNTRGSIVSTLRPSAPLNVLPMGCPTWQAHEKAFYFPLTQGTQQTSTLHILKYSLESNQFSVAFNSGQLNNLTEATVISPITMSPDGQFLAFDSPFDPIMKIGTQITVISLARTPQILQHYSTPFRFSSDPLWSPLSESIF